MPNTTLDVGIAVLLEGGSLAFTVTAIKTTIMPTRKKFSLLFCCYKDTMAKAILAHKALNWGFAYSFTGSYRICKALLPRATKEKGQIIQSVCCGLS